MVIEVRAAVEFDDVATMLGPKRPDANVCWCLTYRLSSKENRDLVGPARGDRVRQLMDGGPIGVLAYDDDTDAWSVWCIRVRPGRRGEGISEHLLGERLDLD